MEGSQESGVVTMRTATLGSLVTWIGILVVSLMPAVAQTRTVLAIADFSEDGGDGGLIHSSQMSTYLQQRLQALAADRLQVVAGDEVRAAMRAQSLTPDDLFLRSRAIAVAEAVGASRIVTGRWYTLALVPEPDSAGAFPRGNEPLATAIFDMWVFDGPTKRVALQARYVARESGVAPRIALEKAAQRALDQAASAIAALQ